MLTTKKKFKTVLDIGSNKIVCFIFEVLNNNEIKILGIGHQISKGIKNGVIINIEEAVQPIYKAVNTAEKMAGKVAENVIINISESHLESFRDNISIDIKSEIVNTSDILNLLNKACDKYRDENYNIIHCIPLEYSVDGLNNIENPAGMRCKTLSVDFYIITSKASSLLSISQCLGKCFLNIEDYVSSAYASSLACLNKNNRELGTILIEAGYSSTSVVIIKNDKLVYLNSIPIGGMHITNDLALCLSISTEDAERLKTLHGNLIITSRDDQEIIDIIQITDSGSQENSTVQKSYISKIIKPRIEEILNMIKDEIINTDTYESISNIVITGGSSQFPGLKDLAFKIFNKTIVTGKPNMIEGIAESTKGPEFSTVTGMITYAVDKPSFHNFYTYKKIQSKDSFLKKIFYLIKNHL